VSARAVVVFLRGADCAQIALRDRALLQLCCDETLRHEKIEFPCAVTISYVTKRMMRRLNKKTRSVDKDTDVLAFPMESFDNGVLAGSGLHEHMLPVELGDIVLCTARAVMQAIEYNHSAEREVGFLTVHALLHLLGYNHDSPESEKRMRNKQRIIMRSVGLRPHLPKL